MQHDKLSKHPWRRHPTHSIREGITPLSLLPFYQVSCSPPALCNRLNIGFCSNKKYIVKQNAWRDKHFTEGTIAQGEEGEIMQRLFLLSSLREHKIQGQEEDKRHGT